MTIVELLKEVGIFSIIVTALSFIMRAMIKQVLNRDIEKFKSDLQRESITYRIRYERLHAERFEVIKDVYKKIAKVYSSLSSLINPLQPVNEDSIEDKASNVQRSYYDLVGYYEGSRIFFEEQIAKEIDSLLQKFREAWNSFQLSQYIMEKKNNTQSIREWERAWNQISKEASRIMQMLEEKFRNKLGIED